MQNAQKRPVRWYLREWREHKGLTQEELAELLGTWKGQISKLETGAQQFNDKWIAACSTALGIEPGDLLRDPTAPKLDDLLRSASPADKKRAIALIETLLKSAY